MFKYLIKKDNKITHSWTSDMYDENHYEPSFGKPQWVEQIEEVLEVKDEAGVVIIPAQAAYQIVHPAEYSIEVVDLSQNQDYLLEQCHLMRKAEYPPMEDYLDAIVKGDEVQKAEYIAKCQAVKAKYPKP